jgi:hypothetical protein
MPLDSSQDNTHQEPNDEPKILHTARVPSKLRNMHLTFIKKMQENQRQDKVTVFTK